MKRINILSLETSSFICGVTLACDNNVLFSENITQPNSHDIALAPLVQKAIKHLEFGFNSLDAVAISAGPGSFTGLRIGAAIAKGLCFDDNIKLISVPTMEALAWNAIKVANEQCKNYIITVLPSRKSLYFTQKFSKEMNKLSEIELVNEEELSKETDSSNLLVGLVPNSIKIHLQSKNFLNLNSDIISYYANYLYKSGKFVEPDKYEPIYVEDFKPKIKENM